MFHPHRQWVLSLTLPVMALAFLSPSLQSRTPDTTNGVIVRAFVAIPPAVGDTFKAGPPIPEADLKEERDFADILRKRNPKWEIEALGRLSTRSNAETETPDFRATAKIFRQRESNVEKSYVNFSLLVPNGSSRYKSVAGTGMSLKTEMMHLPANEAHLTGASLERDKPHQVVYFLTFTDR